MKSKINSSFEIDLVFNYDLKLNKSLFLKEKQDNLIFEKYFWEKVFILWIEIIINENQSALPKFILNKKNFSLSFEIVDNKKIANLNENWLNKSGPTDVLSFPMISEEDCFHNLSVIELGDLFISLEVALNQALDYKHSLKREMLWLASHGLLHLLGWEHVNNYQLNRMLKLQEYLISKVI